MGGTFSVAPAMGLRQVGVLFGVQKRRRRETTPTWLQFLQRVDQAVREIAQPNLGSVCGDRDRRSVLSSSLITRRTACSRDSA